MIGKVAQPKHSLPEPTHSIFIAMIPAKEVIESVRAATDTINRRRPQSAEVHTSESLFMACCNGIDEYLVELEVDQSAASAQLNIEHRQAVHQQVAKAQRGR